MPESHVLFLRSVNWTGNCMCTVYIYIYIYFFFFCPQLLVRLIFQCRQALCVSISKNTVHYRPHYHILGKSRPMRTLPSSLCLILSLSLSLSRMHKVTFLYITLFWWSLKGTHRLINLRLSHCSHLDYFNDVFTYFSGPADINYITAIKEWASS